MAYKLKQNRGRPKVSYKVRSFTGICPKGFTFHRVSSKKKAIVFKREKK